MSGTAVDAIRELRRRKIDGVAMFRPMRGAQEDFFRCVSSEVLLRGGNRSGKSVCVSVRFAAIARGMDITTHGGERITMRRPWQQNRPLLMWVVGFDQKHIGQTIHRLLFRPGLYKIIRDEITGDWRAWDPTRPEDAARRDQTKLSPPLIPESEIETIAWEDARAKIFTSVTLKNGTVICAYSSKGEVKAGDPVDEIWIDEAIHNSGHYPEWQARLSDERGRLVWSSWPKRDNPALREITRRAKHKKENPTSHDDVSEFILKFSNNKFIDPGERDKRLAGWSEEDRIARDEGEYALDSLRMYPTFSKYIHCAYGEFPESDDKLAAVLRANNGQPPADWTRALILDPGTASPAILGIAIPPPEDFGDYAVPYRELYPGRCDADGLARLARSAFFGEVFEWFIIDAHAARTTPMGFSGSVGSNYSRAFREQSLFCRTTGSVFMPGSDMVESRIQKVQEAMVIRSNGRPYLRIVTHLCPNLVKQLEEYERDEREGPQGIIQLDKPAPNQRIDVAVCAEYGLSHDLHYVPRPLGEIRNEFMNRSFDRWLRQQDRDGEAAPVLMGTDAATSAV